MTLSLLIATITLWHKNISLLFPPCFDKVMIDMSWGLFLAVHIAASPTRMVDMFQWTHCLSLWRALNIDKKPRQLLSNSCSVCMCVCTCVPSVCSGAQMEGPCVLSKSLLEQHRELSLEALFRNTQMSVTSGNMWTLWWSDGWVVRELGYYSEGCRFDSWLCKILLCPWARHFALLALRGMSPYSLYLLWIRASAKCKCDAWYWSTVCFRASRCFGVEKLSRLTALWIIYPM